MTVGDSGNSIFVPTVGTRSRVIVREVIPGRAVSTVIFTHGAPRALTEIWSPSFPVLGAFSRFFQSLGFGVHNFIRPRATQFYHSPHKCGLLAIQGFRRGSQSSSRGDSFQRHNPGKSFWIYAW